MSRLLPILLILLAPLAALPAAAADGPEAVVDDLGQSVQLSAPPQRIVSLAPSNTELLFALGLGDRVVGVTSFCNYPPAADSVEEVAGYSDLNAEKIAAVRPDLIVAARGNDAEALETVRRLGVPVFGLANNSVAETIESIRRLGRLTGQQAAATRLADSLQARVDRVAERVAGVERPGVLWGFAGDPIYTAGEGSLIDDVIDVAGGRNLGRQAGGGWPQVSLETLVGWQVGVLLMSLPVDEAGVDAAVAAQVERLRGMDGWSQLPAVRRGRIVHVDQDALTRGGPRIVDGVEALAAALHPRR